MILTRSNSFLKYLYVLSITLGLTWLNLSYFQDISCLAISLSNMLVILGAAPIFFWLKNEQREKIPLLPMHGFFYAITFGIAGFSSYVKKGGEGVYLQSQNDTFIYALVCVIAGLISLYLAYYLVAPRFLKLEKKALLFPFHVNNEKTYALFAFIGYPFFYLLYWLSQNTIADNLKPSFQIVYQFIFYLLIAAYFMGLMSSATKVLFLALIFPFHFFIGSGFLDGSIGQLIINLVAVSILFFAIRQKVPFGWISLIILTILLIQPIKGELRDRIWQLNEKGTSLQLKRGTTVVNSLGELSNILTSAYLVKNTDSNFDLNKATQISYVRMNRLTTLVEVIDRTPYPQPYRYGVTYAPLLTKWIPRQIWPNKPRETLGNDWARAYKLARSDDYAYSYNLPWIAEMYMNFGFAGVLGVSFFIGLLFYFFKVFFCQVENDPARLAFGVLLMCPLMFPESHLSLVLGGVIVGGILLSIMAFCVCKLAPKIIGR
jgi:hypothetical protein